MKEYVCIVGLDEPEAEAIRARIDAPSFARVTLPGIMRSLELHTIWRNKPTSIR
jgi:hypothetical protein